MQKMDSAGARNHAQTGSKSELLGKLTSFEEEFQSDMTTLLSEYSGKINKHLVDLAIEVFDLQEKLSAARKTCNQLLVEVTELKGENANLKNDLQLEKAFTESQNTNEDIETAFRDVLLQDHEDEVGNYEGALEEHINFQTGNAHTEDSTRPKHDRSIRAEQEKSRPIVSKTQVRKFKCDQCSYNTDHRASLEKHTKDVHDKIKDLICRQCGYATSRSGTLKRHIKVVHDHIRDFACQDCGREFSDVRCLREHAVKAHNYGGVEVFKCLKCPFKTAFEKRLKKHIQSVQH